MSYATLDALIERAGRDEVLQVADRDDDGIPDPSVVAAALETADRTIDGYLAVRFAMPLSTVPDLVLKWAVSLARYHLHRDGAPDHVVRDYKDALSELRDASAGRLALPGAEGSRPASAPAGDVLVDTAPSVFDRRSMGDWL